MRKDKSNFKTFMRTICFLAKASPKGFICVTLTSIINSVVPAVFAYVFSTIINLVTEQAQLIIILQSAAVLLIVLLVDAILQSINQIALNGWLFETSNLKLRQLLADKTSRIDLLEMESSKLLNREKFARSIIESEQIPMTYYEFLQLASGLISFVSLAVVLLGFSFWLTILLIVATIPTFICRLIRGMDMFNLRLSQAPESRRLEVYRGWFVTDSTNKEIRITNSADYVKEMWSKVNVKHCTEVEKMERKDSTSLGILEIMRAGLTVVAIITTLYLAKLDIINFGAVAAAIIAYSNAQGYAVSFFQRIGSVPSMLKLNEKVFEYFDTKENDFGSTQIERLDYICATNVSFSYPQNESLVLRNVDLGISKGERIGVVGANGSGKTTLIKLLIGVYAPNCGQISINDRPVSAINMPTLYEKTAFVPQILPKYCVTVREYMCWEKHYEDEQICAALNNAGIGRLCVCLDKEMLKEFGGIELSGGEFQRLAIAKCIVGNPELYVLDEPTSAIDPIEESGILNQFLQITKEKTAIIVTHRLAICQQLDRIIVLDKGKIVESGTHKQLMSQKGLYHQMYTAQNESLALCNNVDQVT